MNALDATARDSAMRTYAQTHDELSEMAQNTSIPGLRDEGNAVATLMLRAYVAELRDPAPGEDPYHACSACLRYIARTAP
jgi:hypothetical protein